MTKEELDKKLNELEEKYKEDKRKLYYSYMDSNRKYNIGDIIQSETWLIRIDKISIYKTFNNNILPQYKGIELRKKDLEPKKNITYGYIIGDDNVIASYKKEN